jgi:hypothetical protein
MDDNRGDWSINSMNLIIFAVSKNYVGIVDKLRSINK